MNATVALGSAAVVLAAVATLLVIREVCTYSLNMRILKAVMGVPARRHRCATSSSGSQASGGGIANSIRKKTSNRCGR